MRGRRIFCSFFIPIFSSFSEREKVRKRKEGAKKEERKKEREKVRKSEGRRKRERERC